MTEEEYRAEMAKQARIANLIAFRDLVRNSTAVAVEVNPYELTRTIKHELGI